MKGSKFLLLLVAAAVLGLIAWFLHRGEQESWSDQPLPAGAPLLGSLPVNDVALVRLRGPAGEVTLRRGDVGWGVVERAGYPANFEKISALVRKLSALQAVQSLTLAPADAGALSLEAPAADAKGGGAGLAIELEDASGRPLGSLLLGKLHYTTPEGLMPQMAGTATGRYVMTADRKETAFLVSEPFSDVQASPSAWIDTSYVRPTGLKRLEVRGGGKDRLWTIVRENPGAGWTLAGAKKGEALDAAKLLSVDSLLGGLSVADGADGPDDARAKPLTEEPVSLVAETFDGVRYNFEVGEGSGDNLPVRVSVEAAGDGVAAAASPAPGANPAAAPAPSVRDEKLREGGRFEGRVVFVPRNFFEPFLVPRSALLAAPAPAKK